MSRVLIATLFETSLPRDSDHTRPGVARPDRVVDQHFWVRGGWALICPASELASARAPGSTPCSCVRACNTTPTCAAWTPVLRDQAIPDPIRPVRDLRQMQSHRRDCLLCLDQYSRSQPSAAMAVDIRIVGMILQRQRQWSGSGMAWIGMDEGMGMIDSAI